MIKETPINFRTYYKMFKEEYQRLLDAFEKDLQTNENTLKETRIRLDENKEIYKTKLNIDLDSLQEYIKEQYINGDIKRLAEGLTLQYSQSKDKESYILISHCLSLHTYAITLRNINDIKKDIEVYKKCLSLSLSQFNEILREYYTEVHKQMIMNGAGYNFGHKIGWTCINRCILINPSPKLDYAATKRKTAELKAAGKKIYNKKEAEWCEERGLTYKAEDQRVFKTNEYCYEIPLIGCKLEHGSSYKLEICDYRHSSVRGKTNEQLVEECNNDINKICELKVDLKTKLTLSDMADKTIYLKFNRNESCKPIKSKSSCSQDR